ncbi:hypothetical protein CB0940_08663 [Cercospora beticola]|uniref:Uncharacterized protein n=1 Tax=Cercospora beticola TaxID=122368 RepID=A0A2G5HQ47_CERBT|nr:hypothetical protein CB0940_08663 [Cercospora beticola]PIA94677.1 hypothetical protein CB0940_08663 [Cercospora beticola]
MHHVSGRASERIPHRRAGLGRCRQELLDHAIRAGRVRRTIRPND